MHYMHQKPKARLVDHLILVLMLAAVVGVGSLVVASMIYNDKLEQLKHPAP